MQDQRVQGDKPEEGKHLRTSEGLQDTSPQLGLLRGYGWIPTDIHLPPLFQPWLPCQDWAKGTRAFSGQWGAICFQDSASAPFSVHSSFSRVLLFLLSSLAREDPQKKKVVFPKKSQAQSRKTHTSKVEMHFSWSLFARLKCHILLIESVTCRCIAIESS